MHDKIRGEIARIRSEVETFVEGLILALDHIDARSEELEECELEDCDQDDDDISEPSLGATEHVDQRRSWHRDDICAPDLEMDHQSPCEYCGLLS